MSRKPTLVLFCSTFRARYAQDILSLTAHPEGIIFHFRYRASWVAASLLSTDPNELIGTEVLCCMVDGPQNVPESELTYLPLRFGELVEVEKEGGVFHVYFRLGRFVHWDVPFGASRSNPELRSHVAALIERANTKIRQNIPTDLRPLKKFCVSIERQDFLADGLDDQSTTTESWQSLVTILSHVNRLRGAVFFKVDALEVFPLWLRWWERFKELDSCEETRARPRTLPVLTVEYLAAGFEIKRVGLHGLKVSYFQPDESTLAKSPKHHIAINYDPGFFYGNGHIVDILSQFDTARTTLYPAFGNHAATTLLILKVVEKESDQSGKPNRADVLPVAKSELMAPEVTIPLRILYPNRAVAWAIVFFCLGALFHFGLNTEFLGWYEAKLGMSFDSTNRKVLPVFGTALGYFFYLIAIVRATRRVPASKF